MKINITFAINSKLDSLHFYPFLNSNSYNTLPIFDINPPCKTLSLFATSIYKTKIYDCDEGNIGSSDSATAKLFSTLNKFNKSVNYNKLSGKGNTGAKEVKIHVKVPLADAIDDVDQISVVGMTRGEYKVEILNAKDALEKQGDNNNEILDVPFVFKRDTEAGMMQLGDMFFGCVAGEEFSPQHTHCEKRKIKDYEKGNDLYSRKDNNFKEIK